MNQKLLFSIITSGCALTLLNSCENPTTLPNSEAKYSSPVLTSSSAGSLASSSSLSSGQISTSSSAGNVSSSNNALSSQTATSSATLGSSATGTSSATNISSATLSSSSTITPSKSMNLSINTTSFNPCASGTRNDIAAYVMTANGTPSFVKTLIFYGGQGKYLNYLATWKTESGASFTNTSTVSTVQTIDGWAGATRASMTTPSINVTWNLKDKNGITIPDGNYTLKLAGACDNISNQYTATASFSINGGVLTTGTLSKSSNFGIGTWTLQ